MSETLTLPVLPLDDDVVLPGMVVPLETSQPEVGAAIDAARMPSRQVPGMRSEIKARVLVVPRLADRGLAGVGTLAVVEQVGRLPGGQPGAVVRGIARVKIGSGTTGPGAALWVEGTVIEETNLGPRADELAQQYKSLITSMLQQRGAWQVIDAIQQLTDASAIADRAGYSSYLSTTQKLQLLETADLVERLELVIGWAKEQLAELDVAESIRKDVSEGMEKQQNEFLLRQQLAAVRKELAELNGDAAHRGGRLPGPRRGGRTCRRTSTRPRCARSTSWSGPRTSRRKSAGSGPGWTPSSTSRGTSGPRTPTTSPARGRSSTRTTPGSTT